MAEFALPKHSKIVKGIDYPLNNEAENTKKINVYRWSPDDDCLLYTSDAADDMHV